ncbi:TIGR03905 family TSCPD domain-containing protein [Desulfotalea psychrophila]|uniref:TIGR03905 family TSCPD domain-containing protein n=1 Tax=Desulfotalea psychrophila TaxID=84980 RepID=UPI0002E1B26B|nr:TIGR03905 family TSCPD domain-containing protein [Desulfotalea psychrophila]
MQRVKPKGVCAKEIEFDVKDGCLTGLRFFGGCPGNLKAIGILLEGMPVTEVIAKLQGITCGNKPTSCADQLCQALLHMTDDKSCACVEQFPGELIQMAL